MTEQQKKDLIEAIESFAQTYHECGSHLYNTTTNEAFEEIKDRINGIPNIL